MEKQAKWAKARRLGPKTAVDLRKAVRAISLVVLSNNGVEVPSDVLLVALDTIQELLDESLEQKLGGNDGSA